MGRRYMIELTTTQLMDSVEAIQKMLDMELKAKTSYQIIRIAREIESEYNLFQKTRQQLIEKYAQKDDNGRAEVKNDQYQVLPENRDMFLKEYEELMQSTIDVNVEPIALEDFGEAHLTPKMMIGLEPFIKI